MPVAEIMIEELPEETVSRADNFAPSHRECEAPVFQPWDTRNDPQTSADADWLFEILMA
jgi:hypothetical protein